MKQLTKREQCIFNLFLPKNKKKENEEANPENIFEIVEQISELGRNLGFVGTNISKEDKKTEQRRHKYDFWIAKEVKKNAEVLNKFHELRLVIDWAVSTKADIYKYSFDEAFQKQKEWHELRMIELQIKELSIPNVDNDRIIFRCADKSFFFYLLSAVDLDYEGKQMKNCVSGRLYKTRVNNCQSLLISLRDNDNIPHVTMEIDALSQKIVQMYGKTNTTPAKEYKDKIKEFALFASGYNELENKELLMFLNMHY